MSENPTSAIFRWLTAGNFRHPAANLTHPQRGIKFGPPDEEVAGGHFALGSILSSVPTGWKFSSLGIPQIRGKIGLGEIAQVGVRKIALSNFSGVGTSSFLSTLSDVILGIADARQIWRAKKRWWTAPQSGGLLKIKHSPKLGSKKAPYQMVQGIDKIKICGYTENRKGAAGKRVAP